MKAAVYTSYGPPDVVQLQDVAQPVPKDNEVLLAVRAAALNPLDLVIKGRPYLARLMTGLRRPNVTRVGVDVAGQVEAVGRHVTQFKPGDAVFGVCLRDPHAAGVNVWVCQGAFAEYACAPESTLALKPDTITFEQAASVPVAALTALQGLRDKGQLQPGQTVLINGASGGVGTFAVQIAKAFGAAVTGVCSTSHVELVRSIGADQVIDYTQEDFTTRGQRYDLVFDGVGNHSLSALRHVLQPQGRLVMVGDQSGRGLLGLSARLIAALVMSRLVSQQLGTFLARPSQEDLLILHDLLATGKVTPVIEKRYRLSEVSEALRALEAGHTQGKIVMTL